MRMFQDVSIIPHRHWHHTPTGRKASIFGAAPWTSEADKPNWQVVEKGYTWECVHHDGSVTVGLSRVPAKTWDEAEAVRKRVMGEE